jgi:hypothetical protein
MKRTLQMVVNRSRPCGSLLGQCLDRSSRQLHHDPGPKRARNRFPGRQRLLVVWARSVLLRLLPSSGFLLLRLVVVARLLLRQHVHLVRLPMEECLNRNPLARPFQKAPYCRGLLWRRVQLGGSARCRRSRSQDRAGRRADR